MLIMMYIKVHKTSFNGQGLTRKDYCFHGLLKDWTAEITVMVKKDISKRFGLNCAYMSPRRGLG
jgi:hypothetical protein